MARVKVEYVVDKIDREIKAALAAALEEARVEVDEGAFFRTFKRTLRRKCGLWETVPDHCVSL